MRIQTSNRDSAVVVSIEGDVGMLEVDALGVQFKDVLARTPRVIVLELSGVPMIASAGMGAMIALRRDAARFGGKVRLAAIRPQVREALRRALFERIFEFYDTVDQAAVIS